MPIPGMTLLSGNMHGHCIRDRVRRIIAGEVQGPSCVPFAIGRSAGVDAFEQLLLPAGPFRFDHLLESMDGGIIRFPASMFEGYDSRKRHWLMMAPDAS